VAIPIMMVMLAIVRFVGNEFRGIRKFIFENVKTCAFASYYVLYDAKAQMLLAGLVGKMIVSPAKN